MNNFDCESMEIFAYGMGSAGGLALRVLFITVAYLMGP